LQNPLVGAIVGLEQQGHRTMDPIGLDKVVERNRLAAKKAIEDWIRTRKDRSEAKNRDSAPGHMRVLGLDEMARRAHCTERAIEMSIADGDGPPVIKIATRRVGVLESDFEEWLKSRRTTEPSRKAVAATERRRQQATRKAANEGIAARAAE
jgi:predicted DNA-binding transcriptional regulator AlpA